MNCVTNIYHLYTKLMLINVTRVTIIVTNHYCSTFFFTGENCDGQIFRYTDIVASLKERGAATGSVISYDINEKKSKTVKQEY